MPLTMKNYCTIYLVRHGETEWNEKKIVQGQTDIPLNKKGEGQAKELAEKLTHVKFDAVFSSDLIRAKRSAEIIILEKKLAVITTNALRERMFGRFEGKHINKLRKAFGELLLIEKQDYEVESDDKILLRLNPFLREVAVAYPGKNVLMVTHGGLLRAFLSHVGFKIPEYLDRPMKNTGYLIIESDGVEFEIKEERLFQKISNF